MLRPLGVLVLAAFILVAPFASASSEVRADFTTDGAIELPKDSTANFHPLAFYIGQTAGVHGVLTTPELRVTLYEKHEVLVEAGVTFFKTQKGPLSNRSFILHNATASFSPGPGLLGLYPGSNGEMALESAQGWTADPASQSSVPRGQPSITDGPEFATYFHSVVQSHFVINAAGTFHYFHEGALKLVGPHVRIEAENVTETDTGTEQTSAVELTTRWVFLEWTDGSIGLATEDAAEVIAAKSTFTSNGVVGFTPTFGQAIADSFTYPANAQSATMDGRFQGTLTPEGDAARLTFSGELRSTSLVARPAPPVPLSSWAPDWIGLALVGAVLAAGVGVAIQRRKRAPATSRALSVVVVSAEDRELAEDYGLRAFEAAEDGQWLQAIELVQAARRIDPTEAIYPLREGIYDYKAGEPRRAIEAFDVARGLMATGEPEYWAALAALKLGDLDLAERSFISALEQRDADCYMPGQVAQAARDAGILERPRLREALEAADRRFPADD